MRAPCPTLPNPPQKSLNRNPMRGLQVSSYMDESFWKTEEFPLARRWRSLQSKQGSVSGFIPIQANECRHDDLFLLRRQHNER